MLTPARTAHLALPICVVLLGFILSTSATANPTGDRDGDGIVDTVDQDDDNDGIADRIELAADGSDRDSDRDGIPDRLDLDSDNDGIPDLYESGLFISVSGANIRVVNGRLLASVGDNGLVDSIETTPDSSFLSFNILNTDESDGDIVPDYLDLDSDNDGILDIVEAGVSEIFDTNGDGRIDASPGTVGNDGILDDLQLNNDLNCCDLDFDGVQDSIPRNTDGGDLPDFQDLDSDNDGINDIIEAGSRDLDQDGRIDSFFDDATQPDGVDDEIFIIPLTPPDSNGDGIADYIDFNTANFPVAPTLTPAPPEPVVVVVEDPEPVEEPPVVEPPEETPVVVDDDPPVEEPDVIDEEDDAVLLDDAEPVALNPIQTGLDGGVGCVIGSPDSEARDIGLVILLLVSVWYLGRRRIAAQIDLSLIHI